MTHPIRIGKNRQLFLDGYVIEWRDKMERRVCPVTKHPENPVIRPMTDLEPDGYGMYGSVIYDEEERIFKAWCQGGGEPKASSARKGMYRSGVYYLTSKDGINWRPPQLNVFKIRGRRTNLLALSSHALHRSRWPYFYELLGVSKDVREADPARRYKMGYLHIEYDYHGPHEDPFHPHERRGLGVAFSRDGIHWKNLPEPVTDATCDGPTSWFWDERTRRYFFYGRTQHIAAEVRARYGEEKRFQQSHWGRAVRRAESPDFLHWTPPAGRLVLSTDVLDGPGDEIYGMCVFPYEGVYIGLVKVYHKYPDRLELDMQLAVSRDSVRFERLSDRSPFLPVGGVGEWDRFNNSFACNPPLRVKDELRFYYGGSNGRHTAMYKFADDGKGLGLSFGGAVGLGSVKLDRFAALESTFDAGALRTKPILFEGTRLHVNANVKVGKLTVKALNEKGEPLPHMEAEVKEADGVDLLLPMKGFGKPATLRAGAGRRAGKYANKPVRLEFALQNGQLFSFWID